MKRVAWYAKKNLYFDPQRCFDLTAKQYPEWWGRWYKNVPSNMGDIYLAYLNILQSNNDSIIICQHGLYIFLQPANEKFNCIYYDQVNQIIPPSKFPISKNLFVKMNSGEMVEIPAYGPEGVVFDIFRFLSYAARWYQRNGDVLERVQL